MKPTSLLLRILNVRTNEWKLVKVLFLMEFFQGAAIAFFFTSAFAMFLDKFDIAEFPKVFIYSAFLLWFAGFIYSKLEARFTITALAKGVTIFMALSFLVFRFALNSMPPGFLFLMIAWFNLLYLLNNLEFWGITSLLFDVRQSKRLFGLISSGDIPAKFVGYTMALLLVSYIGTANLLWVGFFCMLASLPCLIIIERLGLLGSHEHHHDVKQAAYPITHLVKNFSANVLIRRIAIMTVIASATFIIVNFAFYAKVKGALHSDVALAQFIAFFFATVRILALIIKVIFTGRLINRLGIIKSLLITPVLLILLVSIVLISDRIIQPRSLSIYLFGAMAIFVDILRSSINTPVFLTLMQPLSTHERLRAHTITKGIMDPFASLLTGILLIVILKFDPGKHLDSLNYVLMALGVAWIIGIYRIHQQYLKTLLKTIGNRFFYNTEFSVNDASTVSWMKEKLSQGTESEASNVLKLLASHPNMFHNEIVVAALENPSERIRTEAIRLIQHKNVSRLSDKLREMLITAADPVLKAEIITALSRVNIREDEILPYMANEDSTIQRAAIVGILTYGDRQHKLDARNFLVSLLHSGDPEARRRGAVILQDQKDGSFKNEIQNLMDDPDGKVQREAFIAAGLNSDDDLLRLLLDRFSSNEKMVMDSLNVSGENALPILEDFIINRKGTYRQTEKLIRLLGRIGGKRSQKVLLDLTSRLPGFLHIIIKTLYLSNYKAQDEQLYFFETQSRICLSNCARILYMQQLLLPYQHKYHLLSHSLELELAGLRDTLLYIFAISYDREKIKDVRSAFKSEQKEAIANAMEIIEMTVKKDIAYHFNLIFETADIAHKTYALRKLYPSSFFTTIENILSSILGTDEFKYNNWTKACSIYTSKKQHHSINHNLISRYIGAEHPLLSELAQYAV
jgi:ATP:ADP antiporter, AAA family